MANNDYRQLELLERLESLREEMEELGVSTFAELVERIIGLHEELPESVSDEETRKGLRRGVATRKRASRPPAARKRAP